MDGTSADAPSSAAPAPKGFPGWSPWLKVGLWLGSVALAAVLMAGAAWLVGIDYSPWQQSSGGRAILLAVAVTTLFALMALDQRPATDFGLVVPAAWRRQWLSGLLIGMTTYAGYCGLVIACGAGRWTTAMASPSRMALAILAGLTSVPLALTQQVIFSGYLLSLFRRRHGRLVGVAVAAALFACSTRIDLPRAFADSTQLPWFVAMFLIAALLGTMRLAHGGILVPAAVLAGWLFVRRVVKYVHLVTLADPAAAAWWFPGEDPRLAPMLWLALGGALAIYAWRLVRHGEPVTAEQGAISTDFKRVAPLSNVCMLAPLDLWWSRLRAAGFQVDAAYVPRLVAITCMSALNTVLSLPERFLWPLVIRSRQVPDPVFILGVHRSGTTHLHNLLALDPQFVTPRAYQIMNPHGYLFLGWLLTPILGAFSPWKRPMDAVRFHIFSANEEEFALAGMTDLSPYWGLTFPRQWSHYDQYIFPDRLTASETGRWRHVYHGFLQKLVGFGGRRPLLKNPYNTGRVAILRAMYPGARFVHIHRHPLAVYRSNLHMAREGHVVYQLQDPDSTDNYGTRFLDNYREMEEAASRDSAGLPKTQWCEVAYEVLEREPLAEIRRIYAQLGLQLTAEFERKLRSYLETVKNYEKNRFRSPSLEEQQRVYAAMQPSYERWGYAAPERESQRAA